MLPKVTVGFSEKTSEVGGVLMVIMRPFQMFQIGSLIAYVGFKSGDVY